MKTDDPAEREEVRQARRPASAKALGKCVTLRKGRDQARFEVMDAWYGLSSPIPISQPS